MELENIFFNAHHAPIGAFASFTLGFPGASGGLGMELCRPANQNIYIGLETGRKNIFEALPFFAKLEGIGTSFGLDKGVQHKAAVREYDLKEITRDYKLTTDIWRCGDLTFTIYNQVCSIPDPETCSKEELKRVLVPAVLAEITVDNRNCKISRKAFFGFSGCDPYSNVRWLDADSSGTIVGVGQGRRYAVGTNCQKAYSGLGFSLENILATVDPRNLGFGVGNVGAVVIDVEPHKKETFRFAICFFSSDIVTAGKDTCYYYTQYFNRIEEVAQYALDNYDAYVASAQKAQCSLEGAGLSPSQEFMLAHSMRSYYGSTQLLEESGRPLWVVNEGEYRMMNTLDLTADQMFYEITMNPWTVKSVLDEYLNRYSYHDKTLLPGQNHEYPGGISFTHDMGIANVFWKPGYSTYEQFGISGCFSHMTYEELVNWICCGTAYYEHTRDEKWLNKKISVFEQCLGSLVNRDHPDPGQRRGIMGLDSSRTAGGSEITTYDSLDTSLGQARNNVYLAVKTFAVYLALKRLFKSQNNLQCAAIAEEQANRCAGTLERNVLADGCLPAVVNENLNSRIIPVVEGLAFAYFSGCREELAINGQYSKLLVILRRHLENVLVKGCCLFDDNGWKISSTSANSWLSKIYICQFVARKILQMPWNTDKKSADDAHARWLLHPELSYWCWSDQIINGKIAASKYYPRGVTSALWLYELTDQFKF